MLGLVTSTDDCAVVITFGSSPFCHLSTRSLIALSDCLANPLEEDKDDVEHRLHGELEADKGQVAPSGNAAKRELATRGALQSGNVPSKRSNHAKAKTSLRPFTDPSASTRPGRAEACRSQRTSTPH